jgi:type IV secretory pathway TrbD component
VTDRERSAATSADEHGYRTMLHQAPTIPVMIGSVPRDLCIMWWSVILAALVAGLMWQAIPIGVAGHWVFQRVTKSDPYWLHVVKRHLTYRGYYHG